MNYRSEDFTVTFFAKGLKGAYGPRKGLNPPDRFEASVREPDFQPDETRTPGKNGRKVSDDQIQVTRPRFTRIFKETRQRSFTEITPDRPEGKAHDSSIGGRARVRFFQLACPERGIRSTAREVCRSVLCRL